MLTGKSLSDTYLHKGLRRKLVETLREKGITDGAVLSAIESVPRHFFLDQAFARKAYEDAALIIGAGQTISRPHTVAFQTQLLEVKHYEKVLEIGTGSGYQTCVLATLGAQVFTIERQKELYDALKHFSYLDSFPFVKRFFGDGFEGLPSYAPFDKIIITAAAPYVPPRLLAQLKPGGIMVIPVGENEQEMKKIVKHPDGSYNEEVLGSFSFVPMLNGKAR